MYKLMTIKDTVRIPPKRFNENLEQVIISELENSLSGHVDKSAGIVLSITNVKEVGEGRVILGDGAIYYDVTFEALVYQPVLNEVVDGAVSEITEFGAFITLGPIDGLVHVSQITEDFMSYDQKGGTLVGKESKRVLKKDDSVRARIVAISLKDRTSTSKIGLTMRQPYLGKLEWLEEEKKRAKKEKDKGAEKKAEKKSEKKVEEKKK